MINTVSGKLSAKELGSVLCHEHIIACNTAFKSVFERLLYDRNALVCKAVEMLKDAKKAGVDTIIDATPIDLGRDIPLMCEVSEKSGVNIIASSGIYYSEEISYLNKEPEKLASFFIDECKNGLSGTSVLPGILKCATDERGITPINQTLLYAMALVQKETSLPLNCHNHHSLNTALGQIEIFEEFGLDPEKIIIGHCNENVDMNLLEDILHKGYYIAFDRIFPSRYEKQAETIMYLISKGHENKLLVSHDYFAFIDFGTQDWKKQKNQDISRNFCTVHTKLFPELKKLGATDSQIHKLTHENVYKLLV